MSHTFPKDEKLKSRKVIETLFTEGASLKKFPLKVVYLPHPNAAKTQATFAVPKRSFKLAVIRNRIKRQLRETYRRNKTALLPNNNNPYALLFLYMDRKELSYEALDKAMCALLEKLNEEVS